MKACTLGILFRAPATAALPPTRFGTLARERSPRRWRPRSCRPRLGRRLRRGYRRPSLLVQRRRYPTTPHRAAPATGRPVAAATPPYLGLGYSRLVHPELPRTHRQDRPAPIQPRPRLRTDQPVVGRGPRRPAHRPAG